MRSIGELLEDLYGNPHPLETWLSFIHDGEHQWGIGTDIMIREEDPGEILRVIHLSTGDIEFMYFRRGRLTIPKKQHGVNWWRQMYV